MKFLISQASTDWCKAGVTLFLPEDSKEIQSAGRQVMFRKVTDAMQAPQTFMKTQEATCIFLQIFPE